MTFASLAFYLWRQRVSFPDRIAVGQSLLHDPSFHLGKFLTSLAIWTFLDGLNRRHSFCLNIPDNPVALFPYPDPVKFDCIEIAGLRKV
jgi:trk system potassium uptake protein TrkH